MLGGGGHVLSLLVLVGWWHLAQGLKCLCGVSSVSVTDPVSVPSVQTDSCKLQTQLLPDRRGGRPESSLSPLT
jgi:hypothetical protein